MGIGKIFAGEVSHQQAQKRRMALLEKELDLALAKLELFEKSLAKMESLLDKLTK